MTCHTVKNKILLIDNYDSFTYNVAQYLWELGYDTAVHRNDQLSISDIHTIAPTHLLISPGPGTPNDSGICMDVIAQFQNRLPILGICLGHQCIGQFYGGDIVRLDVPRHGKVSRISHTGVGIFSGISNDFSATRYHSLVVQESTLPDVLEITARSDDDGQIMAMQHRSLPIWGVQFHPESIMTVAGHQLLQNFVQLTAA